MDSPDQFVVVNDEPEEQDTTGVKIIEYQDIEENDEIENPYT